MVMKYFSFDRRVNWSSFDLKFWEPNQNPAVIQQESDRNSTGTRCKPDGSLSGARMELDRSRTEARRKPDGSLTGTHRESNGILLGIQLWIPGENQCAPVSKRKFTWIWLHFTELKRVLREKWPLTLILAPIDFFLQFNKSKHVDARGSNVELRAAYRLSLGR